MPTPLTATEPADLDLSRPGTPASSAFGDIYFSVEGGLEESREVFIRGCGLHDRFGDGRTTVAETGFGTGLNFLATWQAFDASDAWGRLHFTSIERYPLSREQLATVLAPFREALGSRIDALLGRWPGRVKGVHRLEFDHVTLDLWHMDVADALAGMWLKADAWFLDGFSPAKNAAMWSADNLARIAELSAPGARLATFTVAGAVRRALADAGFTVERVEGFGRKRHRLEAHLPGSPPQQENPSPVIVGAGIAGASVARALLREGITPTVIAGPDHLATAASANPAALVKPRLDKQDRPESRFFLQAWLLAKQLYDPATRGITHLPKSEAEAERFQDICANASLPAEDMQFDDALRFHTAPVIDPVATCEAFLNCAVRKVANVTRWELEGDVWQVFEYDTLIAEGTHLVLASGLHLKAALTDLALRASRGQLTWAGADVDTPVTYGGYAIPWRGRTLLGATHERLDDCDPYRLEPGDDARNADMFEAALGRDAGELSPARSSVRVNSADTLPTATELEPGLWALTALGSRGFSHAPLLGSVIAASILGSPAPITAVQALRLRAGRGR